MFTEMFDFWLIGQFNELNDGTNFAEPNIIASSTRWRNVPDFGDGSRNVVSKL